MGLVRVGKSLASPFVFQKDMPRISNRKRVARSAAPASPRALRFGNLHPASMAAGDLLQEKSAGRALHMGGKLGKARRGSLGVEINGINKRRAAFGKTNPLKSLPIVGGGRHTKKADNVFHGRKAIQFSITPANKLLIIRKSRASGRLGHGNPSGKYAAVKAKSLRPTSESPSLGRSAFRITRQEAANQARGRPRVILDRASPRANSAVGRVPNSKRRRSSTRSGQTGARSSSRCGRLSRYQG